MQSLKRYTSWFLAELLLHPNYKNPENNKIEAKSAYVLRSGDVVLVAGIYRK